MKLINYCIAALLGLCQLKAQVVGSFDPTFATDGILTINDGGQNIFVKLIQDENDNLLVAYTFINASPVTSAIRKYSVDGSLDINFGTIGRATLQYDDALTIIRDVEILANEKILLGGVLGGFDARGFFVRLNADGSLDQSFGNNGLVENPIGIVNANQEFFEIQSNGKILTLYDFGNEYQLYRFNEDGSIDQSFGEDGKIFLPLLDNFPLKRNLQILENNSFIIFSAENTSSNREVVILKFLLDGTPDPNFGTEGEFRLNVGDRNFVPGCLAIQEDGKLIFSYQDSEITNPQIAFLIRLNPDGSLDQLFGTNGRLDLNFGEFFSITKVFIESNNQFLLSAQVEEDGENRRILSRFIDGVLDTNFGENGLLNLSYPGDPSIAKTSYIDKTTEEKFLIAGFTTLSQFGSAFGDVTISRVFGDIDAAIGTPNQIDLGLKIMPNPVQGHLYFEFGLPEPTNLSVSIFNASGQLLSVVISKERKVAGQHSMSCDVSHLPKGSYFLNLSTTEGEQSIQFIK